METAQASIEDVIMIRLNLFARRVPYGQPKEEMVACQASRARVGTF